MPKTPDWDDIIPLWSHGKPASTMYTYRPVIADLRNFVRQRPIVCTDLKILQDFIDHSCKGQLPSTVSRKMGTVKSLFRFAHRIGAIPVNPADALQTPRVPDELANKILSKPEILRIIAAADEGRNRVLITLLYTCGLRASEASFLKWGDCRPRTSKDGNISVLGKGGKRRSIRLTPDVWRELMSVKPYDASVECYVFESNEGWKKPLNRTTISNIVRDAARKAGLEAKVSAHWMRHGHATHAMDAGAPLALISSTLGHNSLSVTARYLHVNPSKSSTQYVSLRKANKS